MISRSLIFPPLNIMGVSCFYLIWRGFWEFCVFLVGFVVVVVLGGVELFVFSPPRVVQSH